MTVAELIAKLQEMPQDFLVMGQSGRDFFDIEWVGRACMYEDDNVVVVLAEDDIFKEGDNAGQ